MLQLKHVHLNLNLRGECVHVCAVEWEREKGMERYVLHVSFLAEKLARKADRKDLPSGVPLDQR